MMEISVFLVMEIVFEVIFVWVMDFCDLDHVVMDFYDHLYHEVMEIVFSLEIFVDHHRDRLLDGDQLVIWKNLMTMMSLMMKTTMKMNLNLS